MYNLKLKKMKRIVLLIFAQLTIIGFLSSQEIQPFYDCGTVTGSIKTVKEKVKAQLKTNGFIVTGGYSVGGKSSTYVLTFTSKDLQRACLKVADRGILAANLRVAFTLKSGKVNVSALNPKYLFLGYLRDSYTKYKADLDKITAKAVKVFKSVSGKTTAFGGKIKESKLKKYHYMMGMPYFDDPVELKEFKSFNEAITTIKNNLKLKKANTKLVYKLEYKTLKKAVYGVALLDKETGEANFLPKIGEKHLAAMPYEIVVEGNKATILHGRFRFAMYWPELTMGQFSKIMSTPGDVEDTMKALTK